VSVLCPPLDMLGAEDLVEWDVVAESQPSDGYHCLMLDPPWPENGGGKIKRGADRHYDTIRRKEQIAEVIRDAPCWRPAPSSHLWLWTTNTYLPWGLWLMGELGFAYKTNWPWVKPGAMGIGQYGRGCHEILLLGTTGRGYDVCSVDAVSGQRVTVRTDALVGVPRVVDERGKVVHSAKPCAARHLAEKRTAVPPGTGQTHRLEMFARQPRAGWWTWGGELAWKS
jgi:N6-adenosine-specific RNA methylase IME4